MFREHKPVHLPPNAGDYSKLHENDTYRHPERFCGYWTMLSSDMEQDLVATDEVFFPLDGISPKKVGYIDYSREQT